MANKYNREKIYNKTNGRCAYCGCELDFSDFEIDHTIPKSKGGNSKFENLQPCCKDCNLFKFDSDIEEFRKKVSDILLNTFHGRIIGKYYKPIVKDIVFYFEQVENQNG